MKKNEKKLKNFFGKFIFSKKCVILSNSKYASGVHTSGLTKRSASDDIVANRLLTFEKSGERVKLCGLDEIPFGVSNNDVEKENELVGVSLLGSNSSTVLIEATGAIRAGQYVCLAENGCVRAFKSGADEKQFVVGIALSPCCDDDALCEITPYK